MAYCFITIPSIDDVFTRLKLYLLSAQVAMANQALSQGQRSLILEKFTECFIISVSLNKIQYIEINLSGSSTLVELQFGYVCGGSKTGELGGKPSVQSEWHLAKIEPSTHW